MSERHRHATYFWVAILTVCVLCIYTAFRINDYIDVKVDQSKLRDGLAKVRDHSKAIEILKARRILSELQSREAEWKEAQTLCMKDVETVKPSKDHTVIFQTAYCRDRAIRYLGYDVTYQDLKETAIKPIPTSIVIKGAL